MIDVTIEYKGSDFPENITKDVLNELSQTLGKFHLKTNLGVDVHSKELVHISGHTYYKGNRIDRLPFNYKGIMNHGK